MYDIQINGKTGSSVGVIVQKRPNIPSPEKVYDTIEIPGKDGVLYRDTGTVKDIKIEIPLAFREQNPDLWMERLRAVKTWLLSGVDNQLSFADDKSNRRNCRKSGQKTGKTYGNLLVRGVYVPAEWRERTAVKLLTE